MHNGKMMNGSHQAMNGNKNVMNGHQQHVNGELMRRQIRSNPMPNGEQTKVSSFHARMQCKDQRPLVQAPPQPFWPATQPYPNGPNGFANHAMDIEHETVRTTPAKVADPTVPLQTFNGPNRPQSTHMTASLAPGADMTQKHGQIDHVNLDKVTLDDTAETRRVYSGLVGTIAIGLGACIMAILSFQLLLGLTYYESPTLSGVQLPQGSMPQILRDIATALCTVTLTCSICAIMSSFLHFYLCTRIMAHGKENADWKQRLATYQRRSMYIRALSNGGFYLGVIIFLMAMITYQQLLNSAFGSMISSTVVTAILGIGVVFCTLTLLIGLCSASACMEKRSIVSKVNEDKRGTLV